MTPAGTGLRSPSRRTHRPSTWVTWAAGSRPPSWVSCSSSRPVSGVTLAYRCSRPAGSHQPPGSRIDVWSIAEVSGLQLLGHRGVPLPALVLQFDRVDHHGVGARVELRERLVLRDPAAVHVVG